MNMKLNKNLSISIACAFLALVVSYAYLSLKEREVSGGSESQAVLVAVTDIKPYTLMEPGLARYKKIPATYVQPGAVFDIRGLDGRVNTSIIRKGEQILENKLVVAGSESGLSFKIPDGKRAVSIEVSGANGVGGLVKPDDHVDILITFDYGDSERADMTTSTLFQDVEVG